jgi:hypothetical protein
MAPNSPTHSDARGTDRKFRSTPDSAVEIHKKREAQPFRNKVDGFVALSRYRSMVLQGDGEIDRNSLRKRKIALKLQRRTPLLLQDCALLP